VPRSGWLPTLFRILQGTVPRWCAVLESGIFAAGRIAALDRGGTSGPRTSLSEPDL